MADYNLGTARGTIEIEYRGDGARQAREDLNQTGRAAQQAGPSMDEVGRNAGRAGLVIAAGFGLAAKSAMDFEARISAIGAVSGASQSEMDALRNKALQLGKDTAFSAGESAQAMEELIKAGLSVEDVLNGAADATVNLAAAGEVDMATAATIASNAMNQFGLTAKDMTGVVDNIAGAANASAIDVTDFGNSLAQVGAVANLAGASFDDTATAIALMGNAGIKGSDAGTSLKSMFQRLQPTTEKQAQLMKDLGIITADGSNRFYDAQGNMRSMADIAGVLQGSLRGMTKEQKQAALTTLFGSDAIRGAAVLADAGSKGFNKMADSMGKVSAADVAAKRLDNMKGSLEQFKGSLETLGIVVGTMLLPALRQIVDALTAAGNWFLNLPDGVQKMIVGFIALVGASLLALSAFVKIVSFLKAVKAAFIAVRAAAIPAWLAALGPIALVIAAIAAVVAIVILLWKKSETFRDIVTGVWNAIKAAASAVANWFTGTLVPMLTGAWDAIKSGVSAMAGFFASIWNGIKAVAGAVWGAIVAVVQTYINIVLTVIRTVVGVIGAVWRAFWGTFGGVIKAAFGLVVAIVRLGWTIIKGLFLLYLRMLLAFWRGVWNGIVAVLRAVWNAIKAVVGAGVRFVLGIVRGVWNTIKSITSAVWNGIMAVIRAVWARIGGTVMGAVNRVKSVISAAWNAASSVTSKVWNTIKNSVSDAVDGLIRVVTGIKDRVVGALGDAGRWLYDKGRQIIQGLLDGLESMLGAVRDKVNKITDTVGKFLPGSPVREGPLKVLNRGYAGKQIVKMVVEGMASMEGELGRTVNNMMTVPVPALSGDLTRLHRSATLGSAAVPATAGAPAPAARGGEVKGLRLVEGTLSIDKQGRAFIKGVAEEVVMGERHYDGVRRRMAGAGR